MKLCGESLKTLDKFVYLGSTIKSILSMDEKLTSRIANVTAAFKKLVKRAWESNKQDKKQDSNLSNMSSQHFFMGVR